MTYPAAFLKLTWGGKIGTSDIWTNGLNLEFTPSAQGNPVNAFSAINLQDLYAKVRHAYIEKQAMHIASFASLQWIKIAQIDQSGKYIGEARDYYSSAGGEIASSDSSNRNYSDSLVVSLLTDKDRGLAHRGRLYPPAFNITVAANGKIDETQLENYANNFAEMIDGINDVLVDEGTDANGGFRVVVASKTRSGAFNNVTGVEVGNIMDVQRRRRNRISETYRSATSDIG